ncbi:MAG: lipid II-degrading bacteriocin, partial [Candidatus Micrarchaeaceae archaeon]
QGAELKGIFGGGVKTSGGFDNALSSAVFGQRLNTMAANSQFDVNTHSSTSGDSLSDTSRSNVLSAFAAAGHYAFGHGEPVSTGVDQLHLDQMPLENFPHLGLLLGQAGAGELAEGSYKIADQAYWAPPGLNNEATFGHIAVAVSGILTVRSGGFTFTGDENAQPDRYNFNWGLHDKRSFAGEASTIGGWAAGKFAHMDWGGGNPYTIYFAGAVAVKETYP